jgi:hypothetical protein
MEKADYRDNLERLSQKFPGELIPYSDACEYTGCTRKQLDRDKTFPKKKVGGRYYVTVVALAKWLSC